MRNFFRQAWLLYYDGFRSMTLGRTLWVVILLKLAIMFLVLKIFFFPSQFSGMSEQQKADAVSEHLTNELKVKN